MSITSAARWPPGMKPEYALQIGLTAKGLEALKLPASIKFDPGNFKSFLGGAVAAKQTVWDIGPNDPSNWVTKLNTDNADLAHILLSLYTFTPEARKEFSVNLREMFAPVTTRGGLYLFLPGITAIKWMAQNGGSANPWKIPKL